MPLYELGEKRPVLPPQGEFWIAPNAEVMGAVELKRNASVWWGAVLRGDNDPLVIGEESNVQDGSVLHTDLGVPLIIGNRVTIGHMVMLHGCTIGDGSLIGIGSIILNGAVIGAGSLVGANTLITENKVFPPRSTIMGAPGRVVGELSEEESARLAASSQYYVENWKRYATGLKRIG